MATAPELREREAWKALEKHHAEIGERHLRQLFADDPDRGERLVAEGAGLFLDYSKNRVTDETLQLLTQLADECGVAERRDAMFRGEHINVSEDRAVLHVALRMPKDRSLVVDGEDVVKQVHEVLDRMSAFAERIRSGDWKGHTGKPIRNVINIGIGGSDLGPVMAYEALRHYSRREMTFRLRLQRRRHRLRREDPRPRPGGDALHHLLEDLHHAGDDDQRPDGAGLGAGEAGRPRTRSPSTSSPSPPTPRVSASSASTPTTCSASGTGSAAATRWTRRSASRRCSRSAPMPSREMLAGFHAVDEHFRERADRPEPALDHGPAGRLVRGLLRRPDRRRCSPTTSTCTASRPISSSSPWSRTASTSPSTAPASTTTPARSTGASRGPTASIPSTS